MSHRDSNLVGWTKKGNRRDFRNRESYDSAVLMRDYRAKGWTLERISRRFHITRQAVEQRLLKLEWVEKGLKRTGAKCSI